MVKCVKCGAQLKAEDCFCDICGAKQKKEKKCECGFILEEFFAFCPMCGKSLAKETSADIKKMNSIKLEQKILGMKEAFDFVDSYQESDLSTLLLSAVDDGEVPIAAALLEAGADIDVCDDDYSSTPLMKACESGNNDMVKLLLSYEPDLYAENDDGETARDLAKSAGKNYIVRLLNEAESSDSKKTKKSDKLENFSTSIASLTSSLWRKK